MGVKSKVMIGQKPSDVQFNVTAKLGTAANQIKDADVGKAVKLVGAGRYAVCADGDEFEGRIESIENYTAETYTVGTVRRGGYVEAILVGAANAGDYVICAAQAALGTANDADKFPRPKVKATADQLAATISALKFKWRIVDGTISNGGVVTLERVN